MLFDLVHTNMNTAPGFEATADILAKDTVMMFETNRTAESSGRLVTC